LPGTFPAMQCNKPPEISPQSGAMGVNNMDTTKMHVQTHQQGSQMLLETMPRNECKVKEIVKSVLPVVGTFVKSTLRANLHWWKKHAPTYIVDIVENGYIMPLSEYPPKSSAKNNKSSLDNVGFVDKTISSLLASGVIVASELEPHVVNPLTVAANSPTKLRLVLDLRLLNPFVSLAKVKFEDISVASKLFRKNQVMNVFDLSSAYHHVDMHESQHKLLGFRWKQKYYMYTSMPFGLKSAGLCCTKVLRVLITKWRSEGHLVVLYLKDGLVLSDSVEESIDSVIIIREDLKNAGFQVNEAKSS
jgi:hypothetical protein